MAFSFLGTTKHTPNPGTEEERDVRDGRKGGITQRWVRFGRVYLFYPLKRFQSFSVLFSSLPSSFSSFCFCSFRTDGGQPQLTLPWIRRPLRGFKACSFPLRVLVASPHHVFPLLHSFFLKGARRSDPQNSPNPQNSQNSKILHFAA